jgi:hypothetical protein
MKTRNRYRITKAGPYYVSWVKRWWWPFWTILADYHFNEINARKECDVHAANNVVWTSDDERTP